MAGEKIAETPLMKQYFQVKAQYPEAVLLFRVGDFYETFADDALMRPSALRLRVKYTMDSFPVLSS